jgi:hypothetical protein
MKIKNRGKRIIKKGKKGWKELEKGKRRERREGGKRREIKERINKDKQGTGKRGYLYQ